LTKKKALIIGGGIAGLTCAKVLLSNNLEIEILDASHSSAGPVLTIDKPTCDLIFDIWHVKKDDNIIRAGHVVNKHNVQWGPDNKKSTISRQSVVIDNSILKDELTNCLTKEHNKSLTINNTSSSCDTTSLHYNSIKDCGKSFSWLIDASGRHSDMSNISRTVIRYSFGDRHIISVKCDLTDPSYQNETWIEATNEGWLFVAPLDTSTAILQAMVPFEPNNSATVLKNLLQRTEIINTIVCNIQVSQFVFKGYPDIINPLCGPRWISIGEAAASFDPLSGNGVGYAVRAAVLAASVIKGISSGLSTIDCLNHYSLRIYSAFLSHLRDCLTYYNSGNFSLPAWRYEISLMRKVPGFLANTGPGVFGLKGTDLVPYNKIKSTAKRT